MGALLKMGIPLALANLLDRSSLWVTSAFIGQHGSAGFACGGTLSVADLYLFNTMSSAASGFFDGLGVLRSSMNGMVSVITGLLRLIFEPTTRLVRE